MQSLWPNNWAYEPTNLAERVKRLRHELDPQICKEIQDLYHVLHVSKAPIAVLGQFNRLGLLLIRRIYEDAGLDPPKGDNLFSNLEAIGPKGKNEKAAAQQDTFLVPEDVYFKWGSLRKDSNATSHAISPEHGMEISPSVAQVDLDTYLLILEWYFKTYPKGPKIKGSFYRSTPTPRIRAQIAATLAILAAIVATVLVIRLSAPTDSFGIPAEVAKLKPIVGEIMTRYQDPTISSVARDELSAELRSAISKAESENCPQYAAYWRSMDTIQTATKMHPELNPFPQLSVASDDLVKAWELAGKDVELKLNVQEAESGLSDLAERGYRKFKCPTEIKSKLQKQRLQMEAHA